MSAFDPKRTLDRRQDHKLNRFHSAPLALSRHRLRLESPTNMRHDAGYDRNRPTDD